MKTKHNSKTICTRVYSFCTKVNGETKVLKTKTFTFTQHSAKLIRNSEAHEIIPALDLVAGYHSLDLDNFDEFQLAMDAVKHCITWN